VPGDPSATNKLTPAQIGGKLDTIYQTWPAASGSSYSPFINIMAFGTTFVETLPHSQAQTEKSPTDVNPKFYPLWANDTNPLQVRKGYYLTTSKFGSGQDYRTFAVNAQYSSNFYLPANLADHFSAAFRVGFLTRLVLGSLAAEGLSASKRMKVPDPVAVKNFTNWITNLDLGLKLSNIALPINKKENDYWMNPTYYQKSEERDAISLTLAAKPLHPSGFAVGWTAADSLTTGPAAVERTKAIWPLVRNQFPISYLGTAVGFALTYGLGLFSNERLSNNPGKKNQYNDPATLLQKNAYRALDASLRDFLPSFLVSINAAKTLLTSANSLTGNDDQKAWQYFSGGVNHGMLMGISRIAEDAYAKGYFDGFQDGYSAGYVAGWRDGYAAGYKDGSGGLNTLFGAINAIVQFGDAIVAAWDENAIASVADLAFLLIEVLA
jgi:hypothetical protein